MSECNHDCSSCSADCASRGGIQKEAPNQFSEIKKVIAVMSGKGGVGKSLVTSLLAVELNRRGRKTAILDADMTGPSIPRAFGLHERASGSDEGILPSVSKTGVKMMSLNLLLEHETDPVAWRGPVIAGTVIQFWKDVVWGDVDFMFVDMPPGTGDVPLTVFQSLPVDGIIVVTSPQDLVGMIVEKAVKMAGLLNVPILGMVENFSYYKCPDCGNIHSIFGESKAEETAAAHGIKALSKLPIDPKLAAAVDGGMIELFEQPGIDPVADAVDALLD
ncbi:nucleotide-binding protein [Ruminococcus sp. CAG:382]|nr:nucleotide-binding protein [Ruminococcus sp. CAG:382]